jgi:hypothetical protein
MNFSLEILTGWWFYILFFVLLSWLGHYLLTKKVVDDYDIQNKKALGMFLLNFSFSTIALILLIFEVWKIGTKESRMNKWLFTLHGLVVMSLVVIPFYFIFTGLKF